MSTRFILKSIAILLLLLQISCTQSSRQRVPVIASDWWRICEMPDLGDLNGPDADRQHVVDHGFIQLGDSTWQVWACIRGTAVGRLLYKWQGKQLESGPWEPLGIAARANAQYDEQTIPRESIQAPFFLKIDNLWHCFYNSNGIRLMTADATGNFTRTLDESGNNVLYREGGRDVMVLRDDNTFYAYSTISTVAADGWKSGFIIVRTSTDLKSWSDYSIVSAGGIAGNGPISSESPFVVKIDGLFYLFRSSSVTGLTYVYCSENPYDFGVNNDSKLVTTLPVRAPEIINVQNRYYISDLSDFKGIKLARLAWQAR